MGKHNDAYTIKCWNDCQMSGCPGHSIQIEANNTSNALVYYKDGEIKFGMDFDELDAFIKAVHEMRHWVEIDRTFRELAQSIKEDLGDRDG